MVRRPAASGIDRWPYRHSSRSVCPWKAEFARELPNRLPFQPRDALAGRDARMLAREMLAMDVDAYRAAFKRSPLKRAKLPAMKRNAAVVLGYVGAAEDADDDCPSVWPPTSVPCRCGSAQPAVTI